MVSIIRRMRALKTRLLSLRLGPGAALLPPEITRLHLSFAPKMNDGHMGSRKFWRTCLPRLKYHNPAVPMLVSRDQPQEGSALLTISFADPEKARAAAAAAAGGASVGAGLEGESGGKGKTSGASSVVATAETTQLATVRTEVLSMKHKTDLEILDEFMQITRAVEVQPTPEDVEELAILERQKKVSDHDAEVSQRRRAEKRRAADMLAAARGEAVIAEATT